MRDSTQPRPKALGSIRKLLHFSRATGNEQFVLFRIVEIETVDRKLAFVAAVQNPLRTFVEGVYAPYGGIHPPPGNLLYRGICYRLYRLQGVRTEKPGAVLGFQLHERLPLELADTDVSHGSGHTLHVLVYAGQ